MLSGELKGTVSSIIKIFLSSLTNTISCQSIVDKRSGSIVDGGFSMALKPFKSPLRCCLKKRKIFKMLSCLQVYCLCESATGQAFRICFMLEEWSYTVGMLSPPYIPQYYI